MEKIKSNSSIRRRVVAVGMGVSALLAGCSEEQESQVPETAVNADQIRATGVVSYVSPGETVFVNKLGNENLSQRFIEDIPLVDHIYPNGREDDKAPLIGGRPLRIRTQVVLQGEKSNNMANDASCDTLRIDQTMGEVRNIGALALGGEEDAVFISWPETSNGAPAEHAYVCMFQDVEPGDDGVVLFADTQSR